MPSELSKRQAEVGTTYVNERGIPDLFQQLLVALMMTTPDDHLAFLISCLAQLKHVQNFEGNEPVRKLF